LRVRRHRGGASASRFEHLGQSPPIDLQGGGAAPFVDEVDPGRHFVWSQRDLQSGRSLSGFTDASARNSTAATGIRPSMSA